MMIITRFFPKENIYYSKINTGFKRHDRNNCEITMHAETLLLGSLHKSNLEPLEEIANSLSNSGIPTVVSEDLDKAVIAKLLINCTVNVMGGILRASCGEVLENSYACKIMNKIIEEIFSVIDASGYKTFWKSSNEYIEVFYRDIAPGTASHKTSTCQDIINHQKTEIDSITGKII